MKIGISEPATATGGRDGAWILHAARVLEDAGFSSMWVPERITFFPVIGVEHPYAAQREVNALRENGMFDSLTTLAAIAAVTTRLRIGPYVGLVALRHPIVAARQIATIDQLSGGRVDYGVGVGWLKEEYDTLGVPWAPRGALVTEYLRAMKTLWTTNPSEFHGKYVDFPSLYAGAKPVQQPHPPIAVGGNSRGTIARIVAVGDRWLGYGLTIPQVRDFIARLHDALTDAGRHPSEVMLSIGYRPRGMYVDSGPDEIDKTAWSETKDYIAACAALGLKEVVLSVRMPKDGYEDNMREFAHVLGVGASQ